MRLRHLLTRKIIEPLSIVPMRFFQELCGRVPNRWRQGRRFQIDVLRRMSPSLMDIPYHSHLLPVTAPLSARIAQTNYLHQQEEFARQAWRDYNILIEFNHYYTNFSQWYRSFPFTLEFIQELLGGGDCRIADRLFKREWIKKVLQQHYTGTHDNRTILSYLIGAELFLRLFEL